MIVCLLSTQGERENLIIIKTGRGRETLLIGDGVMINCYKSIPFLPVDNRHRKGDYNSYKY